MSTIDSTIDAARVLADTPFPGEKTPPATARPFIRCMGGKWRLRHVLAPYLRLEPPSRYIEPFAGGAAMFFALNPSFATLVERDIDLVNLYHAVTHEHTQLHAEVSRMMTRYRASPERLFYETRARWNSGDRSPALNLFLRSTTFNGLWRQNAHGELNAPWCRDTKDRAPSLARLAAVSVALRRVTLIPGDFERAWQVVDQRSVVYCDPPYFDAETKYNAGGFSIDDLIRLLKGCSDATRRGARVVMSNHDRPFVRDLVNVYWPEARIDQIMAPRAINSDGTKRGKVPEVVVYAG